MFLKLPFIALWLVVGAAFCYLANVLKLKRASAVPRIVHSGALRLFGLSCARENEICTEPSTLYLSNHVSYLDIFLLGSIVEGSFVAKLEVSKWPILGKLAAAQRTVFLERRTVRVRDQIDLLRDRLATGRLILFPEGTSTPGSHVEAFKSSLLAAATGNTLIQPVSIAYTHYAGNRMTVAERNCYAWYLPMEFGKHFLSALGLKKARAVVTFLPPVRVADFSSRKACAEHCEEAVRRSLLKSLDTEQEYYPASYRPYSVRWKSLAQASTVQASAPDVGQVMRVVN